MPSVRDGGRARWSSAACACSGWWGGVARTDGSLPALPRSSAGTLLGCAPNNFVAVNAGAHLGELRSLSDLYSSRLLLLGAAVGAAALLPVWLKSRAERSVKAAAGKQA